jgi:hypothetical protein
MGRELACAASSSRDLAIVEKHDRQVIGDVRIATDVNDEMTFRQALAGRWQALNHAVGTECGRQFPGGRWRRGGRRFADLDGPGAASGSAVIELDELFCTPISESSEASYGPCVLSCATDGPASVTVTSAAPDPRSRTTAGGYPARGPSAPAARLSQRRPPRGSRRYTGLKVNRIRPPGRVAQWESARFTRERSQIRNRRAHAWFSLRASPNLGLSPRTLRAGPNSCAGLNSGPKARTTLFPCRMGTYCNKPAYVAGFAERPDLAYPKAFCGVAVHRRPQAPWTAGA